MQTPEKHILQQAEKGMRSGSPRLRSPRTVRIPLQRIRQRLSQKEAKIGQGLTYIVQARLHFRENPLQVPACIRLEAQCRTS